MDISPTPFLLNARIFFIAFGMVSLVGGIIGFLNARRRPSLSFEGVSGVLLIVGGILLDPSRPSSGFGAVLVLLNSLTLLGQLLPALLRGEAMPAAYMVPLSAIGTFWGARIFSTVLSPD